MSVAPRPGTAPKGGPDAGATGMRSGRQDMAIRSWPGYERSGTSPGREVPAAGRGAGAGGAATERRGSGDRRAPSPVGPRCGPVMSRLRPRGRSIIKSRAEPSRAEPSRAEPSRAEPSRAEPSAPRSRGGAAPPDLTHRPRPPGRGTPTLPGLANRPQAFPCGSPPASAVNRPGERGSVAERPPGCLRSPRCRSRQCRRRRRPRSGRPR